MRSWANLPAGLRSSSLTSTSSRNGAAHHSGGSSNKNPLSCGNLLRMLVRGAPHAGTRRVYPYHRRLAYEQCSRQFSNTSTSRIRLEDDEDEDHEPSRPQKPARRVVNRPLPAQSVDMRTLILSRKPKPPPPKPKPPPKPPKSPQRPPSLTPQQFRDELGAVEKQVGSLPYLNLLFDEIVESRYTDAQAYIAQITSITQQISSDIGQILYAHTEDLHTRLSESKARCQAFETRFCQIIYGRTPQWTAAVSKIRKKVSQLENEFSAVLRPVIVENVELSWKTVTNLRQLLDSQYLNPRKAARANVDKLLAESEQVNAQYIQLQSKGRTALSLLDDILQNINSLKTLDWEVPSRNGLGFGDFQILLSHHKKEFGWAAHAYRSAWAVRKRTEGSFKNAHFWSAKDFTDVIRSRKYHEESSIEVARCRMFADILHRPRELALFQRETVIANHLCRLYMKKWIGKSKRVNAYLVDITWRQLDVMAPFEIKLAQDWWLQEEVLYLMKSFDRQNGPYGPMWSKIDSETLNQSREFLKNFQVAYVTTRQAFFREMDTYRHINWHRLKIEEKLHELREPNLIKMRGLFVPEKPLSESVTRFNYWRRLYAAIAFRAWVLRKLNTLPAEFIITELGEATTQYAKLSKIFLKTVQAPFVPEIGTEVSARSNRPVAKQRRSTGLRMRPVLPVFRRKFGEPMFTPNKTEPPGSLASDPTESPFSEEAHRAREAAHKERAIVNKPAALKKTFRQHHRAKQLKLKHGQGDSATSIASRPKTQKPAPQPSSKPESNQNTSSKTLGKPKATNPKKGDAGSPAMSKGRSSSPNEGSRFEKKRIIKSHSAASSKQKTISQPSTSNAVTPKCSGASSRGKSFMNAQYSGRRSYSSSARSSVVKSNITDAIPEETNKHSLPLGVLPKAEITDDSIGVESKATSAEAAAPLFWSHGAQRSPSGEKLIVHYCRSLQSTEEVAKLFLNSKVIGFDMEWKAQASSWDSIQNNLSVIQIANEERIALFQLSLFKPAKSRQDFIAPSLRKLLESQDITKVGVAIKGDATRLRKFLSIEARSIFELSHLFRLVKYGQTNPKLVNKRGVNLSDQVEEHFGLPLEKSDDVRCGDWTVPLNYRQVQYAATDPYACICLFNIMDQKRQAMDPMPPLPAHADLNMPIVLPRGQALNTEGPAVSVLDDATKANGS